jgi:hypothetical protein
MPNRANKKEPLTFRIPEKSFSGFAHLPTKALPKAYTNQSIKKQLMYSLSKVSANERST